MVFRYCKCCCHMAGHPEAEANFFRHHFVPTGWELNYFKLSECAGITLSGYCDDCHEALEELISLPKELSGDDLLKAIYDTMQAAHPYDEISKQIGYYGDCEERSLFYTAWDKQPQLWRSKEFLKLFNDYDLEQARVWLEKNFPPQKHTEVFRDTGGSLFSTAVRLAKENGHFDKAEAILDYMLPCEHETGSREKVELTSYEFNFEAVVNYGGSEGIYVDCCLRGKFDKSGRSVLHVGTLKTLRRDLEALQIMGELCGTLTYYANQYVNQNLHRYTPSKQLAQEYERMWGEQRKKGGGDRV